MLKHSKSLHQLGKKKGFKFVSGHIQEGISKRFKYEVEILQKFNNWHGTNKIFEYYRRLI